MTELMTRPSICSTDFVRVERGAEYVRLTLNRPDRLNAVSDPMLHAILETIDEAADDPDVRALVIEGAGRAFCAGADLADDGTSGNSVSMPLANQVIQAIVDAPLPVVASVQGPAAGFGCSLVLACDLSVMARSAYLLLAFSRIGLVPDGGLSATFATTAGRTRAMRAALLAERIGGDQAFEWGLVTHVVDDHALDAETASIIDTLTNGATAAYAEAKSAINSATLGAFDDTLEMELRAQARLSVSVDYQEGLRAFRNGRAPKFVGG